MHKRINPDLKKIQLHARRRGIVDVERVLSMLKSKDGFTFGFGLSKLADLASLGHLPKKPVFNIAIKSLDSKDEFVRMHAVSAISILGMQRGAEKKFAKMLLNERDEAVFATLLRAVRNHGSEEILNALIKRVAEGRNVSEILKKVATNLMMNNSARFLEFMDLDIRIFSGLSETKKALVISAIALGKLPAKREYLQRIIRNIKRLNLKETIRKLKLG